MESQPSTAVVTGASRGIGRAIAKRLARAGHHIVAVARSREELAALAEEIEDAGGRCTPLVVDLTDPARVQAAFEGIPADVLVNNAGMGVLKPFIELTPDEWEVMVDLNVNALYHATRALLPGMLERGRGHIVLIGSIAGRSAFIGGSCYASTKAFVTAFGESLMLEV